MRKYNCLIDNRGDKIFVKEYNFEDIKNSKVLEMEYRKGIAISKIIPYPKPLRLEKNKIYYEFIDIRKSLWKKLNFGSESVENDLKMAGKYLRKMHDNNIMHGDFTPSNVIFDNSGNIYFIDASFSPHNTAGEVLWEVEDIYHDISLFLMQLYISKPIWKPWIFFKLKKNKKRKQYFLDGYFDRSIDFNPIRNCKKEIEFLKLRCQYLKKQKKWPHIYAMIFLAKIFILIKRVEVYKLKKR